MSALATMPPTRPDPALEDRTLTLAEQALGLTVVDQVTHDNAAELLLAVKGLRNEAEAHHRPMINAAHQSHKISLAALQKIDDPLKQAEQILKTRIGGWEAEQLKLQAEQERIAREQAEAARAAETEAEIEQAEAAGAPVEEVQAIISQAEMRPTPRPVVAPTFVKAKGVSTVMVYAAEVFDIKALCRAVADGKVSSEMVQPNMTALNGMARALKSTMQIPGVRCIETPSVRAGGR